MTSTRTRWSPRCGECHTQRSFAPARFESLVGRLFADGTARDVAVGADCQQERQLRRGVADVRELPSQRCAAREGARSPAVPGRLRGAATTPNLVDSSDPDSESRRSADEVRRASSSSPPRSRPRGQMVTCPQTAEPSRRSRSSRDAVVVRLSRERQRRRAALGQRSATPKREPGPSLSSAICGSS